MASHQRLSSNSLRHNTHTHVRARTHAHARTHARTHTHTHTRTHTRAFTAAAPSCQAAPLSLGSPSVPERGGVTSFGARQAGRQVHRRSAPPLLSSPPLLSPSLRLT